MNAQEAKNLALSIQHEKNKEQYNRVKTAIEKEVNKGQFRAVVDEYLLPGVKQTLEDEGFKITSNSRYNDISTSISWE